MSATVWRECPSCHEWRTDVTRDHLGARERCGECSSDEFGRCSCCGYKHRALKSPQEGGHDPLACFEESRAAELRRRADRRRGRTARDERHNHR